MRNSLYTSLMVLFIAVTSAPAWAEDPGRAAVRRSGETTVVFVAHDYGFSGPERISGGLTTVRIVNEGRDLHHIQFLKLLQGKSAADFRAAIAADPSRLPKWVQYAGGPNAHLPGSQASATVNLTEGDYVLMCWIPDKNGVPHVALGMQKALFVRGGKPTKVARAKASITITQIDYQFILSKRIEAGVHTIEVLNHGTQPHELVVVKLAPGATVQDAIASFEPGASRSPQGELVGGITGIERGERVHFTGEFATGRYGLICFVPDAATGRPHFLHGMTTEFTVE
ncbi:MAG TPA: hypothetical protein VFO87_08870 [Nitrospira sp.]|nr:hypothetical protein [Nitrospira sp.]